ncbi:MAG: DUF4347 domain-containing protein, partial [Cyanobacteria bacterium J06588_5]
MFALASIAPSKPAVPSVKVASPLVIIDGSIDAPEVLAAGLLPGAGVSLLDPQQDGVSQISAAVANHGAISSLHIVSHGSPGCLRLGNSELSLRTLGRDRQAVQGWFAGMADPSECSLVLYGCNVGAGEAGAEFLAQLHQIVKHPVYGTRTKTGNAARGGTWQIEAALGSERSVPPLPMRSEVLATYPGLLPEVELIADINPGSTGSYPVFLTEFDGKLFFNADDGVNGDELWVSDGTAAGTQLVADINPGSGDSNPGIFTEFDDKLFFGANSGDTVERGLWVSDGTAAGTQLVADISLGGPGSDQRDFTAAGGKL